VYEYACHVDRVVDGDTMHVSVDLGFEIEVRATIRLLGVNAPEMRTEAGKYCRIQVSHWLLDMGHALTLHTQKDRKEKYGRYLGVIYRQGDPVSLNDYMIINGLAVEYNP
jgi:micrococcal nuclease